MPRSSPGCCSVWAGMLYSPHTAPGTQLPFRFFTSFFQRDGERSLVSEGIGAPRSDPGLAHDPGTLPRLLPWAREGAGEEEPSRQFWSHSPFLRAPTLGFIQCLTHSVPWALLIPVCRLAQNLHINPCLAHPTPSFSYDLPKKQRYDFTGTPPARCVPVSSQKLQPQ